MGNVLDDEKYFHITFGGPMPPPSGNLWIVNSANNKVHYYDTDGNPLFIIDIAISLPWGICIDRGGNLWIAPNQILGCSAVQYDRLGNEIRSVEFDTGDFTGFGKSITLDEADNFWLGYWDEWNDKYLIAKFDTNGNPLTDPFAIPGMRHSMQEITYDPNGYLWVLKIDEDILQYSLDGIFIKEMSAPGRGAFGITLENGFLWINSHLPTYGIDPAPTHPRIYQITTDGLLVKYFDLPDEFKLQLRGIAIEAVVGGV